MYASSLGVIKTVAKVNRVSYEVLESIGMDSAFSSKAIAANRIVAYARALENSGEESSVQTLYKLVGGQVEALEFKIENASLFKNYHYEVVFDFVAKNAFATHDSEVINKDASFTITAPSAISADNQTSLANEVFGISGITEAFNKEYFQNHNVKYNAQIVMVTKWLLRHLSVLLSY
jgi:hypothetical protein